MSALRGKRKNIGSHSEIINFRGFSVGKLTKFRRSRKIEIKTTTIHACVCWPAKLDGRKGLEKGSDDAQKLASEISKDISEGLEASDGQGEAGQRNKNPKFLDIGMPSTTQFSG